MSQYKYEMMSPVARPGVAVRILERNESGLLIGEYKGYYRYESDKFTLYPSYNPFAAENGNLKKKTIWASDVRCKKQVNGGGTKI